MTLDITTAKNGYILIWNHSKVLSPTTEVFIHFSDLTERVYFLLNHHVSPSPESPTNTSEQSRIKASDSR